MSKIIISTGKKKIVAYENGIPISSTYLPGDQRSFEMMADRFKRFGTFQEGQKVTRVRLNRMTEVTVFPTRKGKTIRQPKNVPIVQSVVRLDRKGRKPIFARSPAKGKFNTRNTAMMKDQALFNLRNIVAAKIFGSSGAVTEANEYISDGDLTYGYVYYTKRRDTPRKRKT